MSQKTSQDSDPNEFFRKKSALETACRNPGWVQSWIEGQGYNYVDENDEGYMRYTHEDDEYDDPEYRPGKARHWLLQIENGTHLFGTYGEGTTSVANMFKSKLKAKYKTLTKSQLFWLAEYTVVSRWPKYDQGFRPKKYWLSAGDDPIFVLNQDLKNCQAWILKSGLQDKAYKGHREFFPNVMIRLEDESKIEFKDYFCQKMLGDTWDTLIGKINRNAPLEEEQQTNLDFLNAHALKLL